MLIGFGSGFCYILFFVVIGYNFEKKRNFVSGVVVLGVGIGVFILVFIL